MILNIEVLSEWYMISITANLNLRSTRQINTNNRQGSKVIVIL